VKLGILNTSIVTSDGSYTLKTISTQEAQTVAAIAMAPGGTGLDSAVGHDSTAQILTTILGVPVPVSRQLFAQQPGQHALVFKLNGRPEPGVELTLEQLKDIGFSFKVLVRNA
jgi:hypothetical protein